jgi:hypothetical protein
VPDQLVDETGVEDHRCLALSRGPDEDHLGTVLVGEAGDAPAQVAVVTNDAEQVAISPGPGPSKAVHVFSDEVSCRVERLDVDRQLGDDVGLDDVEDLDGAVEELGELDGGVDDTYRARPAGDRHNYGRVLAQGCRDGR